MKRVHLMFVLTLILISTVFGQTLSIQGVLRDNTGASVADGQKNFTFRLYTVETGGTKSWDETQQINVLNGVYGATLGTVNSLAGLNYNVSYWLGISIDGAEEMTPRTKLTLSPYAIAGGVQGTTNVFPQSGNVGIGTTNPSFKLHVAGQIYTSSGLKVPSAGVVIANSNNDRAIMQTGWLSGFGDFTAINSGYDWDYGTEPISVMAANEGVFFTRAVTTGSPYGETMMRIHKNGNVGIGTTNPGAKLDVSDGTQNTQLTGNALLFTRVNNPGYIWATSSGGYLAFGTNGRSSMPSEANFVIKSDKNSYFNSNVGIGTTSPQRALHVIGGAVAYNENSYSIRIEIPSGLSAAGFYWDMGIDNESGDEDLIFRSKNGCEAYFDDDDGAFGHSSDLRLKKNIEPMTNVLDKVMQLKPSTYQMKTEADTDQKQIGFIAQDVQVVFPEINIVSEHNGVLGLYYEDFSVLAIAAIQEQQKTIQNQQKEIDNLKAALARIEASLRKN